MTTFTSFVTAIAAINISGVSRLAYPPLSLNTASLPTSWPMLPNSEGSQITFGGGGRMVSGNEPITCDLIIAFEAVGQNRQIDNFAGLLTLVDSAKAAIASTSKPTPGPVNWSMKLVVASVAKVDYWAISVTFTGYG